MAKSIAEIQPHLESYDWKVRAHAADDLGDTGDAKAVPLLIEALYDESQFIRMAAAAHWAASRTRQRCHR